MGDYGNFYRQPTVYGRPGGNQITGYNNQDDRLIGGGFLGPFLLGGITGGLVAPFFYGPRPRPVYYPYPPYPPYYPPYRPY